MQARAEWSGASIAAEAVDTGSAPPTRAWRVRTPLYAPLVQPEKVTAIGTPQLGYVRSLGLARSVSHDVERTTSRPEPIRTGM